MHHAWPNVASSAHLFFRSLYFFCLTNIIEKVNSNISIQSYITICLKNTHKCWWYKTEILPRENRILKYKIIYLRRLKNLRNNQNFFKDMLIFYRWRKLKYFFSYILKDKENQICLIHLEVPKAACKFLVKHSIILV